MRVLVTGNLGFVGSAATEHLKALGHYVVGLDTGYFQDCFAVAPTAPDEQLILDTRAVERLPEVDAVVQLAAISNDPLGVLNAKTTYEINVDASVRIASAAKAARVSRYVFASSCSMYGVSESGIVDETSKQNPQTAYAKSKVLAERAILDMASADFSPVSFRFATAYGFSARPRLDLVVNNLIAGAIAEGEIILESDGTPWRPLVNVRDMARAIGGALATDRERIAGEAYNVGCDEENYQVREIARIVSEAMGGVPLRIGTASGSDTRSYRVSFEKLAAAFPQYLPQERLRAAITDLVRQYKAALKPDDYASDRFFRLRRIARLQKEQRVDGDLYWTKKPIAV